MARRQVERHDAAVPGGDFALQPLPVLGGETREPVNLLDQDDITAVTVGQEAEKLRPGKLGAALVLNVPGGDRKPAVGGERFELGTGTAGILRIGRSSQIVGSNFLRAAAEKLPAPATLVKAAMLTNRTMRASRDLSGSVINHMTDRRLIAARCRPQLRS